MTGVVKHLNLDTTLGAAFVGSILAATLYGITCLQTVVYGRNSGNDPLLLRLAICFLWLLDTLHMGLVTHALYYYLIKNFDNPFALASPNWSILLQAQIAAVCGFTVRMVYCRRIWIITKHNIPLAIFIVLNSLVGCCALIVFEAKAFRGTFADLSKTAYLGDLAFGFVVLADIAIASTMCIWLLRSRTGFKKTDTILNTLIIYSINSSLLTTICGALIVVFYLVWPKNLIFVATNFCISKLYINSLLAMLNERSTLREQFNGVSSIPVHLLQGPQFVTPPRTQSEGQSITLVQKKNESSEVV